MILEIHQLIWLETPKGQGTAKFLIDNGPESDLQWVCFITATREIWTFSNWDVRVSKNETLGRTMEVTERPEAKKPRMSYQEWAERLKASWENDQRNRNF